MFNSLPNELWWFIAALMSPKERFLFAATCRRARAIISASWPMWKRVNDWGAICEFFGLSVDDRDAFPAYLRAWCWSPKSAFSTGCAVYDVAILKELTGFFLANPDAPFQKRHLAAFAAHPVEKALFGDIWTSGNVVLIERAHAVMTHRFTVASYELPVLRSDVRMRVSEAVSRSIRKVDGKEILVRLDDFLVLLHRLYRDDSSGFLRFCSKARDLLRARLRSVREVRAWLDGLHTCYRERANAEPMSEAELVRLTGPWRLLHLGEVAERGSEVDGEDVPS